MGGDENLEKSDGDQIKTTSFPAIIAPARGRGVTQAHKYKNSNEKTARANMRLY